jgi:hypothetical protein
MSASEDEVKVKITGEASGANAAMRGAAGAVKDGVASMKDSIGSITGIFQKFNGVFLGLAAIVGGGKLFKSAIDETREFTKEAVGLSRALGITATEASTYVVALDDVGSSTDDLKAASQGLTRQLKTNESGLNQIGIVTRDSNGHLRTMGDILMDGIKVVNSYKEGADRNLAAQTAFGRGVQGSSSVLKLNVAALEEAKQKQEELGLVVGVESVQAAKEYRVAMNDVHDVLKGLQKAVGDAVMPVFTQLAQWFSSIGPAAVTVLKNVMAGLVSVFWGLYTAVTIVWELMKAWVTTMQAPIRGLAMAIYDALHGNFSKAKDDLANIGTEVVGAWSDSFDKIVEHATKARDRMEQAFGDPTKIVGGEAAGKDFVAPKKASTSDDRFREWALQLEKFKEVGGEFREHDIAADIQYWQAKLALVAGSTEKDKALRDKIEHQILQLKRASLAEEKQIAEEAVAQKKAIGDLELQNEQERLRFLREMGRITETQELSALKDLEEKKIALEQQALAERLKLVEADKLARQKVLDEIEQLQIQSAQRLKKIDDDATIARKKQIEDMMSPVVQAVQQSVQGMIQGTTSLRSAIANLGQSILGEFVSLASKKLVTWVAGEIAMTKASVAGAAARTAAQSAAHKQGLAMTAASAIKEIAISAYTAMANVYRSVSAIPYVGWILAPAMAVAAGAAVFRFGQSIASASGGYDIPAGTNPITQLHEREMVLPKAQAEAVREMAAGGGGGRRAQVQFIPVGSDHGLVRVRDLAGLLNDMNWRFQ